MHFERIETERLILAGLTPLDMKHIFENCSKLEAMKILGHRSEEDYQKEAYKQQNGYAAFNRSFMLFLITHKVSNTIIGRCGIHNWNQEHKRAEVGYVMEDENYRRKGLMTETLAAVIKYGFHQLNLNRMEALVGTGNMPSLRLMEIFNFQREGQLREHFYSEGKYEDSVVFSLLRHEYLQEPAV